MLEAGSRSERSPWGQGEEVTLYRPTAGRESETHFFFDDRGLLVGYIGLLYEGLDLASQPAYDAWLAKQTPTDFLLPTGLPSAKTGLRSGRFYSDQGERVIGRAIVINQNDRRLLYIDSNVLTAFASLLSPYKPEFLSRIALPAKAVPRTLFGPDESEGRDYIARQHFAKGEVAHFALCGASEVDLAIEAYKRAIDLGLSDSLYQAEASHRLGLAYRDKGLLPEAAGAIETSLKIRPAIPEVINHLGKVYAMMGNQAKAVDACLKAIGLRPNYANAHFNLAEAIEAVDPRRALTAYENYLAYTQETPGEQDRIGKAKERVEALKKTAK
jgi:tetratricopeptide (TPR) repeat protein